MPIQLPIDFNAKNESDTDFDILLADGKGNYYKKKNAKLNERENLSILKRNLLSYRSIDNVHDVSEFHEVMDSILEHLDILIHIIEDAGPEDVDGAISDDTEFGSTLSENHSNDTDDSGLCNSHSEVIKLIDS